jgi:rhamnosyltransferase
MPAVSIIIRSRNEERWIGRCLKMVFRQSFRDFEVVLVDNLSSDHSVPIARRYPVKVVSVDRYRPGRAINDGVRASSGDLIVCLSAHCIPRDEHWLANLVGALDSPLLAGVYGRQLPFSYSSDFDKRDLLITFGLDRRVQTKDSFFHNANSLIRRDVWEKIPFDEELTNIEDRAWGGEVIAAGYQLAYEPEAAVYHHHGIHQDRDQTRASNVIRIMESLEAMQPHEAVPAGFSPDTMRTVALLPVRGKAAEAGSERLLARCLEHVTSCRYIEAAVVISDDDEALDLARTHGAHGVRRPESLNAPDVGVEDVLRYALLAVESDADHFDTVAYLDYLYPFRPPGFLDRMVEEFARTGMDSLVPTLADYHPHWITRQDGDVLRPELAMAPREFKEPVQRGLLGLGAISSSEFIRAGTLLGENIGLVSFEDPLVSLRYGEPFASRVIEIALLEGTVSFQAHDVRPVAG